MPLVRAHFDVSPRSKGQQNNNSLVLAVRHACRELVPAGFNSKEGPLSPGSIEFIPSEVLEGSLTVNVLLEIEAYDKADRAQNLDERCEDIRAALKALFPDYTFGVWGKLVNAGWASDSSDPPLGADMSMEAALMRVRDTLGYDS